MADMFMYHNRLDDLYITDVTASSLGTTRNEEVSTTWETRNLGVVNTNGYYINNDSKTASVLRSRTYSIDFNRELTTDEFSNIRIFASDNTHNSYNPNNVRSVREELTVTRSSTKNRIFIQKISDLVEVDVFWGSNTGFVILIDVKGFVEPSNDYNLTQNLINCVSSLSSETIGEGEQTIILNANSGFVFSVVPTITIGEVEHNFILSDDNTQATITINIDNDVVINANAVRNLKVFITGNIENATCNYNDGDFIDTTKNIIISANIGKEFKGNYYYVEGGNIQNLINNVTSLIIDTSLVTQSIYLEDNYIASGYVEQLGSFVNLYYVTQEELTELSKKRFVNTENGVDDFGKYINNLYILPFALSHSLIGDKSNIILGTLNSGIESTLINNYMYEFNGGTIEIPMKYGDIYDFVGVECLLHLPFNNPMYINSEYVIGQTITLNFKIDLYSGTLTIDVYSTFNNSIVQSVNLLIGMNIPFIQSNSNIIGSLSSVNKNAIKNCFIEVTRNIPYKANNNIFGGETIEYGKIGDYEGFTRCDNIILNSSATNTEKQEIKQLLNEGVII